MAVAVTGGLLGSLRTSLRLLTGCNPHPAMYVQTRDYALRKGTRERKLKKKLANIKEKLALQARMQRQQKAKKELQQKITLGPFKISMLEESKPLPYHNIWLAKFHPWKLHTLEEAIMCHRQTHHPTMYNLPSEDVELFIELKQQSKKKGAEGLPKIYYVPHSFKENMHTKIVVFSKNSESVPSYLLENILYGGRELIKQFEDGTYKAKNFDYVLTDYESLPDLIVMKGLLKQKFPNAKLGTLGNDLRRMIEKFKFGIRCETQNYTEKQSQLILAKICIGKLDMDVQHLEENFKAILAEMQNAGKLSIRRIRVICQPSVEQLKLDLSKYLQAPQEDQKSNEKTEEEEEENFKQAVIDAV